jgi:hypothetical protein
MGASEHLQALPDSLWRPSVCHHRIDLVHLCASFSLAATKELNLGKTARLLRAIRSAVAV